MDTHPLFENHDAEMDAICEKYQQMYPNAKWLPIRVVQHQPLVHGQKVVIRGAEYIFHSLDRKVGEICSRLLKRPIRYNA